MKDTRKIFPEICWRMLKTQALGHCLRGNWFPGMGKGGCWENCQCCADSSPINCTQSTYCLSVILTMPSINSFVRSNNLVNYLCFVDEDTEAWRG